MTAAKHVCSTWQFANTGGVMETTRHIGIDLHRNKFTCCVRLDNGRNYLSEWQVENLPVL